MLKSYGLVKGLKYSLNSSLRISIIVNIELIRDVMM